MSLQRRRVRSLFVFLTAILSVSIFLPVNANAATVGTGSVNSTCTVTYSLQKYTFGSGTITASATAVLSGSNCPTTAGLIVNGVDNGGNGSCGALFPSASQLSWVDISSTGCAQPSGLLFRIYAAGQISANFTFPVSANYFDDPNAPPSGTGNTCVLTDAQLVKLARGAGFPENQIVASVAIALAESAGKVNALNHNLGPPSSWDIGPWQINDIAHPEFDRVKLFVSPGFNAHAAYSVWSASSGNFTAWSTYKNGSSQNFYARANAAYSANLTGVLGGNSCADLPGGIITPPGTDPNNPSGNPPTDNPDCHFTINIFTILKCAFIPSNATGWKTQAEQMSKTPPFSTVSSAISWFGEFNNTWSICKTYADGIRGAQQSPCINGQPPVTKSMIGDIRFFDPLDTAGDFAQTNTYGKVIFKTAEVGLYGFFIFWAWKRIARAFGSNDAAESEGNVSL